MCVLLLSLLHPRRCLCPEHLEYKIEHSRVYRYWGACLINLKLIFEPENKRTSTLDSLPSKLTGHNHALLLLLQPLHSGHPHSLRDIETTQMRNTKARCRRQRVKWTSSFAVEPTVELLHVGRGQAEPWSEVAPVAEGAWRSNIKPSAVNTQWTLDSVLTK